MIPDIADNSNLTLPHQGSQQVLTVIIIGVKFYNWSTWQLSILFLGWQLNALEPFPLPKWVSHRHW